MNNIQSEILKNVWKVHLIGIGGIGMSGIAEFLSGKGYIVTGSDLVPCGITDRLKNFGIKIYEGHNAENIHRDIDLVVYSSAVKEDNPEYSRAKKLGIKMLKRAAMLGELVNDMYLISVSGTHGKTSTSAMIAKVLIDNGFDPTVFVGGTLDFLEGGSSRIGKSKYAVVEADEYDRSFLTLKSDIAVITNIELDHTDIYSDIEDLKKSFKQFLDNSKNDSRVIACGDNMYVLDVLSEINLKIKMLYGLNKYNNYILEDISVANGNTSFRIDNSRVVLNVPGVHNALNASAAYATCAALRISQNKFIESIYKFSGVKRRLELKYKNDIRIYDDYAHHPSEVSASLNAIKNIAIDRIITVFQPHTFTRTRDLYLEFANALKENDVLILTDIYPAREKEIKGVSTELIYNKIKESNGDDIYYLKSFDEVIEKLNSIIRKNDTIIFQGAGSITDLCDSFVKKYCGENL